MEASTSALRPPESQPLAKLRLGHLVRTPRDGTRVVYVARNDHVRRIVEEALLQAGHVVKGLVDRDDQPPVPPAAATRRPA